MKWVQAYIVVPRGRKAFLRAVLHPVVVLSGHAAPVERDSLRAGFVGYIGLS